MSRTRLIFVAVLATPILALVTGCIIFMEDHSEGACQQQLAALDEVAALVDKYRESPGGLVLLAASLEGLPSVEGIGDIGKTWVSFTFASGVRGYVVFPSREEQRQLESRNERSNLAAASLATPLPDPTDVCPPWTSRKALVVLADTEVAPTTRLAVEGVAEVLASAGFVTTYLYGEEFTFEVVASFSVYGVILLTGHGGPGFFQTGEKVTPESLPSMDDESSWKDRSLMLVASDTDVSYWNFAFTEVPNGLPGSLVYLNGCETSVDGIWESALLERGASVFLGNRDEINKILAGLAVSVFSNCFFSSGWTLSDSVEQARNYSGTLERSPGHMSLKQNGWPSAEASRSPASGPVPLFVTFDGSRSTDPDGEDLVYEWAFGDGHTASGEHVSHTYEIARTYSASLVVRDACGHESKHTIDVFAGSSGCSPDVEAPSLSLLGCPEATSEAASFTWSATDNCSSADEIQYRYRLDTTQWWPSDWCDTTSASYSDLPRGSHFFEVQARDGVANESEIARCSFAGDSDCPPAEGLTEFTGRVHQLGPPPIAWISERSHVSGVDITQCYTGPYDVEVYCGSPCAGFTSPNLQVGDDVEVRGYFRDGGNGAWAEISIDGAGYYLRRTSAQIGETFFRGTAISEPGLIGAVSWTVSVDEVFEGADISSLTEVVVRLIINPTACFGNIYGDIQPGDTVWVYGYFDGAIVDLCPEEHYYLCDFEPM